MFSIKSFFFVITKKRFSHSPKSKVVDHAILGTDQVMGVGVKRGGGGGGGGGGG